MSLQPLGTLRPSHPSYEKILLRGFRVPSRGWWLAGSFTLLLCLFAPLSSGGFSSPAAEVCTLTLSTQICKGPCGRGRALPAPPWVSPAVQSGASCCRGLLGVRGRAHGVTGPGSCGYRAGHPRPGEAVAPAAGKEGDGAEGFRLLGLLCRRTHLPLAAPGAGLGAPCWGRRKDAVVHVMHWGCTQC